MPKPIAIIKTYYDEHDFTTLVKQAEKAGFRERGLFLYKKKKNAFEAADIIPNTKGLAKFLKWCVNYYKDHEVERAIEATKLTQEEERIKKRKEELGLL